MNLSEHLNHFDHSTLFHADEFNNAIRFLYTAIAAAIHDRADVLVVKSNGFEWYKDGALIDKFLGGDAPMPEPSYNANLHKILERDEVLKKHLEISIEKPEETIILVGASSEGLTHS